MCFGPAIMFGSPNISSNTQERHGLYRQSGSIKSNKRCHNTERAIFSKENCWQSAKDEREWHNM